MATAKVNEAITFAQGERFAEAEALLLEAQRINPDDPEMKHQLGMVYVRTGRSSEGHELLREAVEARPTEALYWSNLAAAYLSVELSEQGAEAARRAVALMPGYSEAWQNLAFALRDLKQHAEAATAFERGDATGTMAPAALASWGESVGLIGRFPDAERLVRRALVQASDDPAILTLLGWIMIEQRKEGEARDAFKRSLEINANQFLAAFNYGVLLLRTPDTAGALRWLRRATSLEIKSIAAWRILALELARHGHDEEALPAAERALRLDPDDKAIAKLLQRLKGHPESGIEETVFDFGAATPIGPDVAAAAGKRDKQDDDLAVLDFSTINFGTEKD